MTETLQAELDVQDYAPAGAAGEVVFVANGEPGAIAPAPATVAEAADRLRAVLLRETALARNGGLAAFAEAIRDKRAALVAFTEATARARESLATPNETDREALRQLVAATNENALVLDAVRATIDDLAARLRKALTAASDPGTYGPTGRGPRHARAVQLDTRI